MSAKITAALHEVMQAVSYVQKTGFNDFHKYRYAGEADLLDKLRPAMLKAGLLLVPSVASTSEVDAHGNVFVTVEYTLAHKDGEVWPEKIRASGCGNDRSKNGSVGDKGVYKALTGANKYLLFKLFQIETGDDPEANDAATYQDREPPAPPPPPIDPEESAQAKDQIIKTMDNCDSVSDLDKWRDDNRDAVNGLLKAHRKLVFDAWQMRRHSFEKAEKEAS